MTGLPEITLEVKRWVEKAENDLTNAEHVIKLGAKCPTDTVCFHCQQSAEKYLKALLISREVEFPKTHDLTIIHNLCKENFPLELDLRKIQPLNRYSIEARYPGDWEPIDLQEATDALKMAIYVRNAVRDLLPKEILKEDEG